MRLTVPFLLSLVFFPAAAAQTFQTGVNQAWLGSDYGHDLSDSFDAKGWARVFTRAAAHEARVVRVWLCEDMEGIVFDELAQPAGIEPEFLQNVATLARLAREHRVRIYWTLHDGNRVKTRTAEWLRLLLTDEGCWGTAYRCNVLAPLLEVLQRERDVAWGLDLLNETQGALRSVTLDGKQLPPVWPNGWDGARAYLATTIEFCRAHAPALKLTASAGHHNAAEDLLAGRYDGLGLDFYDLHVYSRGSIPEARRLVAHAKAQGVPIVLGEFGPKKGWVAAFTTWVGPKTYARHQTRVTRAFLKRARRAGFVAAFPWRLEDSNARLTLYDGDTPRPALAVLKRFARAPGVVGSLPQ